jgi:phospholipid/cholesterol/gamma-HCH transport system substrate-binding protein
MSRSLGRTMRRDLRRQGRWLIPIFAFMAIAVVAGAYLAVHERLRTPFQDRYALNVELASSESLTPGLGQPVNVAGVRVGDIVDARLHAGRSIVSLSIDPHKLPRVFANAQASLHPNTPLKDMQIDLYPGGPPARPLAHGATIPLASTQVPLDLVDFNGALDADTRAYFGTLVRDAQLGLRGRGEDLRQLLVALGPTAAQVRQIAHLMSVRRADVSRLVHNLNVLTTAAAARDRQLGQAVAQGDATVSALAGQDAALRTSISGLPPTLASARSALAHATTFAGTLGPTLDALMPAAKALPGALRAARPLLARAEPLVRSRLRPLVRQAQPLVAGLTPAVHDLSGATPDLTSAFRVLDYVANELVYEPPNREGYLFWLAWFAHNTDSMLSLDDAHGSVWRTLGLVSCASVTQQPQLAPLLEAVTGVAPVCPPAGK